MEKEIVNILKRYDFIECALLFGSYAKGNQTVLSDLDIAIFTSKDIDLFTMGMIILDLESEFLKKIDLVVVNELYKIDPKFSFNITNGHKVLFCKDQNKYVEFKANSLKYYFDMTYMYDMFDKKFQERLSSGDYGKVKAS